MQSLGMWHSVVAEKSPTLRKSVELSYPELHSPFFLDRISLNMETAHSFAIVRTAYTDAVSHPRRHEHSAMLL